MNIFFTGHKGFLGTELIPHLQKNHNVFYEYFNLCDKKLVEEYCYDNNINFIIHAAIKGGRRVRKDEPSDFYNNILMFENLQRLGINMINFCSGAAYGRDTSIDGLKEYDTGKTIPTDYYGLAKYQISMRCSQLYHVKNLRFFNVFGPQESDDRFIKANIKRYLNNEPQIVFVDKYMDFFGIEDTKTVVDFYIKNFNDINIFDCINLVYDEPKVKLTDVCNIINNLSDHKVDVIVENKEKTFNYYGDGRNMRILSLNGVELNGLIEEIRNCYNYIK